MRDQILAVASSLFGHHGYEKTSMKAIAEKAKMTPAGMYYYFDNKQALLYECLEQAVVGLTDECANAIAVGKSPTDKLRRFVVAHITYQLDRIADVATVYTRWVYASRSKSTHLNSSQQSKLRKLEASHFNNLSKILTDGSERGDFNIDSPTLTGFAIIGMCEHVLTWARKSGSLSTRQIGEKFADYAIRIAGGG